MKSRGDISVAAALALVALSALPFFPTLHFGLVWDDSLLLTQVGTVAQSGGVPALFTTDFRLMADRPLGYYRPVTTTSLWVQVRDAWKKGGAGAMAGRARALHTFNVILHVICALLVWRIARRLTRHAVAPWMAAALFAVHPAHVEPVAFISARTDLLAAAFVLASVWCWLHMMHTRDRARTTWLLLGAFFLLAGALAKEQALLLPVVLIAWTPLVKKKHRGWWRQNGGWLVAWLAVAVVAVGLRIAAHVGFGPAHGIAGTGSLVWFARLGLPALLVYLRLWFFPWPLNPYYTSHDLAIGSLAIGGVLASALLLFLGARSGRTRAALGAFAFALLFLAPVLHLAPLGGAVAAERFFYLPSAGLALLTGLALESFELYRSARIASRLAVVAAMAACIPATVNGVKPWASDATLFAHMVEVSPDAATAHRGLADVLLKAGNPAGAIREAREATRLDPGFADAYELLGVASAKAKDYDTARESFLTVARLDPDRASAYVNLGVLAVETNDLEAAEKYFTRAVEIDPANPDFHFKLGTVFVMKGDADGALREVANLETLDHAKAESLRQMMTPPPATTPSPGR